LIDNYGKHAAKYISLQMFTMLHMNSIDYVPGG